jgi:hypothetical protein
MTHITIEREKLAQVQEALEDLQRQYSIYPNSFWDWSKGREAITFCKQALAAQPAPVQKGVSGYIKKIEDLIQERDDARSSRDFYKRRADALQQWQSKMRDPERTIVCDILANGCTLEPAGDRYTPPAQPVQPVASLKEVDVLMMAETHGIDPSTKGLYGFYIDCISNQPVAQPEPVPEGSVSKGEFNRLRDDYNDLVNRSQQDAKDATRWRKHVNHCQLQGVDLDYQITTPPAAPVQKQALGFEVVLNESLPPNTMKFVQPAPVQPVALRDALADSLGSVYVCDRVWSAWGVGTMTQDDFYPAAESDEVLDSLVEAIAKATPPAARRQWVGLAEVDKHKPDMGAYVYLNDDWLDGYKTGMEYAEAILKEKNNG